MLNGTPTFRSMDEVQQWALERTLCSDLTSAPRGMETRELLAASFTLSNPRRRCVTNPARRWSLPLAIGELCWHLAGSDDLSFIAHYAPRWSEFSDDNATIWGSCYGKRVFGRQEGRPSQWDMLIDLLRHDPMSRRAILNFQQEPSEALRPESKDTACATVLQFFVRGGAVHAVAYMRSNDVVWGLPYDVFLFTMLQEMLATTLGLGLGSYHHVAGSLHLYERHFDLAARVLAFDDPPPFEMPTMASVDNVVYFLGREASIRTGAPEGTTAMDRYWEDLLTVLRIHADASSRKADELRQQAEASPYAIPLRPLIDGIARKNP